MPSYSGLTSKEAQARFLQYGPNLLEKRHKKPLIISFLEEFKDLMVIILIFAAIIAGIGGEPTDASVILFIVVLNATIGFVQKFKAEKALEALQKMLSPHAKVLRDGKTVQIDAAQVVPGDILILNEGDNIVADAQLLEENELEVNESALTGESTPVVKNVTAVNEKNPAYTTHETQIFMGTSVTHGTARAVVLRTGMNTEFGKIANLTQATKKDKSPLQKELFKIGIFVGKITFVISAILLAVGWLWQGKTFVFSLLFATSVAVAAVPEGLPATITIALAIGVQRLAKKRSIVKKLSSVETLGSTTTICSDKTGTLTKNEMTVVEAYILGEEIAINGSGYSPEGAWSDLQSASMIGKLCRTAVLCNNSTLSRTKDSWQILGDPTEGALLTAAAKATFTTEKMNRFFKRLYELPFDSNRKMMTTLDQDKKTREVTAHLKGAPDEVLKICTHAYEKGKIIPLTPQKRKAIETMNILMASRALRVLAFAERPLKANEVPKTKKECDKKKIEKGMIFIGLMGMIDPPRPEVYEAVKLAHQAGIRIIVITGDYGETAYAIAKELKIFTRKKVEIIIGEKLQAMKESTLSRLFKQKDYDFVFARVSPEHKLKIVHALKKNGEIVAMTGDGVNDAPALKRADIGVAMGITGTDVSKEAADMVLTDDSFGTIVTAIEEGRIIYTNLKKFVFYVFSCNIGELITIFTAILLNIPAPLTAILILAVNLGTDVLPAITLGVDPPEPGLMQRPPRSQKEHLMKRTFILRFLYVGLWTGAIVVGMYLWTLYHYGWQFGQELSAESLTYLKASTSAFALLVLIQMANAWNSRSEIHSIFRLGIFKNRWLLGAVSVSILTVIAFVQIPFFQKFLHTTSLSWEEWGLITLAAFAIIIVEEGRKLLSRISI